MSEELKLGQIITTPQHRDAIHIAVVPVVAAVNMQPGTRVALLDDGRARVASTYGASIGVVDPFLLQKVLSGQQFWLYLNPGSITSLRHEWTHPAFPVAEAVPKPTDRSASETWMREWAKKHTSEDYYGDSGNVGEEAAYAFAIDAGHRLSVGPYESATDYINDEWWGHWEAITGAKGQRGEYFSCSC